MSIYTHVESSFKTLISKNIVIGSDFNLDAHVEKYDFSKFEIELVESEVIRFIHI